jgi:hypothetical protein
MKAYEAKGLSILEKREALTKAVTLDKNGTPMFININNGTLIPQGANGIQYFQVAVAAGYTLCGGSENNPSNLNKKNIQFVKQGDWISIVGGVLAGVSNEYFEARYPRIANPNSNNVQTPNTPLNSESLNVTSPSGNTTKSSGSSSY